MRKAVITVFFIVSSDFKISFILVTLWCSFFYYIIRYLIFYALLLYFVYYYDITCIFNLIPLIRIDLYEKLRIIEKNIECNKVVLKNRSKVPGQTKSVQRIYNLDKSKLK